jgi:hypothetical protein
MPEWPAVTATPSVEEAVREHLDAPSARLALSNYRAHILRNAFAMLARILAAPKSNRVVIRAVRNEAFPTAWQLALFLGQATGRFGEELARWRQAIGRVEAGEPPIPEPERAARGAARRRPRRRRGPRGRQIPVGGGP